MPLGCPQRSRRRGPIYVVGNVNVDLILGVLDRWPPIGRRYTVGA